MKLPSLLLGLLLGLATVASGAECPTAQKSFDDRKARLSPPAVDFLARYLLQGPTCAAFNALLKQMTGEERRMGFRLEDPRAPDVKAAQADLDKAVKDPAVRKRLDQVAQTTTDANMRLGMEASVLDDEGYYGARDLKIAQLREHLK